MGLREGGQRSWRSTRSRSTSRSSAVTNAASGIVWLLFAFSPNLASHNTVLCYALLKVLLYSKSFRFSALALLHLARLAASHLLPRYCLHRPTCIRCLLIRSYTTAYLRTRLARGKYDTKVIARRRYIVASRIPKRNLSQVSDATVKTRKTVSHHLSFDNISTPETISNLNFVLLRCTDILHTNNSRKVFPWWKWHAVHNSDRDHRLLRG